MTEIKSIEKICVVGGGKWGKNHISTLNRFGNLAGLVDSNQDILDENKKEYPYLKLFSSLEKSFEYPFDGYVVATPAETHFDIAKKIINTGKDVLVEKPFTTNVKDAEYLYDLSESKNVNVMVGHILLFHPAINKIKKIIDENKIGKLQYIYSNRLNLGRIRTEENVFWSFAPHDISVLQYLINDFPEKISSNGAAFIQENIHDTTLTLLSYPNNIKCHIYVSWLHPFKEHRLVVIGSKGMLTFEDSLINKPLKFYDKKITMDKKKPVEKSGDVELIEYGNEKPLDLELKYFINNINRNKVKISNALSGLEVIKILDKSSKNLNLNINE